MKNFFRLARFAWPYRVRFGLSLCCAAMVAVLWSGTFGAVYPLLQILFNSQNCQKWLGEKVEAQSAEVKALEGQIAEVDEVLRLTGGPNPKDIPPALWDHYNQLSAEAVRLTSDLREREHMLGALGLRGHLDEAEMKARAKVLALRSESAAAEARLSEFKSASRLVKLGQRDRLPARRATLEGELGHSQKWLARFKLIQPFVNKYLPSDNYVTLVWLMAVFMLGVALRGLFQFLQDVLVADVMQLCLFDIRNLFFRRTLALDLASFSQQGSAEIMARFTNDMDSLSQGLNTLLSKVVREPLRVITCLGGAMWFNWRLTCLTLVIVPISVATTYRAGKIMKRAVRRSLESMSNIYKILQESFQGIKVVKAFTMERHERRRFFLETKSLYKKSVRVAMIDALSDPALEMLALLTVVIALLAGSYLVLRQITFLDFGSITLLGRAFKLQLQLASQPMAIEDLLTLYSMLAGVSDPIRKLANVHSKIQRAAAASDRICSLMDRQPTVADRPTATRLTRHRQLVEFEKVHFSYNGREPVIRGLDLVVPHGETIALVGPNGCGKTTLMNLLPRFWDVGSGAIRIDGKDLREVGLRSLRGQIGMVTQETILFDGTLADNIAYGSRHAKREAIEAAAKRAYAHQFISAMPDGYDTIIGERGTGLSGGQRQRIALARAMLRDPAILILDEATSAVDIQDEALIRKAIEEFARGRTTFLITHSLGSLQFAHRIVLMNAGRIEAVGTDSELLRTSPLYRRLHEIHFQRESA